MNSYELARYNAGLLLKDAARQSHVNERTIRRLETGEIDQPSAPVAKALAKTYGVTVSELLGLMLDGTRRVA